MSKMEIIENVYTARIEEYDLGDGRLVDCEIDVWVDPPVVGSYRYDAPSDVDYHGKPATLDGIKAITVERVYLAIDDTMVDPDPGELAEIEERIATTIDDDVLMDAIEEDL